MDLVSAIFKKADDPEEIFNQIVQLLALHGCSLGVGVESGRAVMLLGEVTDDIFKSKVFAAASILHPLAIQWAPERGAPIKSVGLIQ